MLLTGGGAGVPFSVPWVTGGQIAGKLPVVIPVKVLHARAGLIAIGIRHGSGRAGPVSASACGRAPGDGARPRRLL